jgi:hypothetical protein
MVVCRRQQFSTTWTPYKVSFPPWLGACLLFLGLKDVFTATFMELKACFPGHFKHTFAVKSAPLPALMQFMVEHDIGMESASFAELALSLR